MIHLDEDIFLLVKSGVKNVEARLYDEKRSKIKVGDKLGFIKRPLDDEIIYGIVTDIKRFSNFSELADNYSMESLYKSDCTKEEYLDLMKRFYSEEEQKQYGVVAISFELCE